MKNRYSNLTLFGLMICVYAAHAEEQYQAEISAGLSRADSQDYRTTTAQVAAEVFFAPVKIKEHPYAVAAFIERIGSITVSSSQSDSDGGVMHGYGQSLLANINFAKPDFPLAIKAGYSVASAIFEAPSNNLTYNEKIDGYHLGIGNYFAHTLLAGIEYSHSNTEVDVTQSSMPAFALTSYSYSLFAQYVDELEHGKALGLSGHLASRTSDDLKNISEYFSAEYFFNRGLSAGLGIGNSSGKDLSSEGQTYSAGMRYFASPFILFNASYARSLNANAGYAGSKSFGVGMALRF